MTCPECGTKIGVFRRKFSNTAYCSEACRQTARQTQNQASLAMLLSNKKRHMAQAEPAPAPPVTVEVPPERAREAVHSGALTGFARFGRPEAHPAPPGIALIEEEPAAVELAAHWQDPPLHAGRPGRAVTGHVVTRMNCLQPPAAAPLEAPVPAGADWGVHWQDAVRHLVGPGLGITGWIVTAMSCLQPLAAVLPPPCGEMRLPLAATRTRSCDTLRAVWDLPAAELAAEPELEPEPIRSRWIARPLIPVRMANQWLGLGAPNEFASPVEWRSFAPRWSNRGSGFFPRARLRWRLYRLDLARNARWTRRLSRSIDWPSLSTHR